MKHPICISQPLSFSLERVFVCGSSDGLYLIMEMDSNISCSPPPPTWPHHFSLLLNVLVLPSEATGWIVSCLLTPLPPLPNTHTHTPSSPLLLLPEKTAAPLQTPVLTAQRGEMESSQPLPQAVLYSNGLHVKSPLQTMVLLCCSQRLSELMCVGCGLLYTVI